MSYGLVDVHTHLYLPRYTEFLRNRGSELPRIVTLENGEDRLLILPDEDKEGGAGGRYMDETYWSVEKKLELMDANNIDASVVSLANPWLDFLHGQEARSFAQDLNADLDDMGRISGGRIYGFGTLPLNSVDDTLAELQRVHSAPHLRGVIIGTNGLGNGLDDPKMFPVWEKIAALGLMAFIHPHYGVGGEKEYGGYGHSLYLAMGFPFETTTAIARMVLSGIFEKLPHLKLLLAHSGGCLPFLAGRLDSCAREEPEIMARLTKKPSEYLENLYYDAITYDHRSLQTTISFATSDNLMYGTDNPFSISNPAEVAESLTHFDDEVMKKMMHGNAGRVLDIDLSLAATAAKRSRAERAEKAKKEQE